MENEIWKVIPEHSDYEVSNFGRVRSNFLGKSFILKQGLNRGYKVVILCGSKKKHYKRVSRLILETFVSKCPEGMECSHIDDNKLNNRLDNLVWESRTDNSRRKKNVKLNFRKVSEIRELLKSGKTEMLLSQEFGVSRSSIQRIKNNKIWKE